MDRIPREGRISDEWNQRAGRFCVVVRSTALFEAPTPPTQNGQGSTGERSSGSGSGSEKEREEVVAGSKTFTQLVEEGVEKRLKDMLSSGEITFGRASLELLYYVPRAFRDAYVETFLTAIGGEDMGTAGRGRAAAEAGALGRAKGRARGSTKRTWRGEFIVKDERALRLKERADKRLRALAREMNLELEDIKLGSRARGGEEVVETPSGYKRIKVQRTVRRVCSTCKLFMDVEWRFCPHCGTNLED